jgi:hypothetical protein
MKRRGGDYRRGMQRTKTQAEEGAEKVAAVPNSDLSG